MAFTWANWTILKSMIMISLLRGLPYRNRSEGVCFTTLTVKRFLQIVFPNGSIDPWHALGIVKNVSSTEQAIFIEGNFRDIQYIPKNLFK